MGGIVTGAANIASKATPWGLIAGAGAGLLGAIPSIVQMFQAGKDRREGRKELDYLLANQPKYNIPDEYMKSLGIYQNLATGEMPGKSYYEQQIGQTSARAMTNAERGAISSTAYGGAVVSAQDKELQAIQNLAQMNAQWQAQQQQGLAGAYGQMGQLKDTQFQQNVVNPWNIKANMASEKAGTGAINQANAANDLTSMVQSFVGTTYYNKILQGLQNPGSPMPTQPQNPTPESPYPYYQKTNINV